MIALTIDDSDGGSSTTSQAITVANTLPTILGAPNPNQKWLAGIPITVAAGGTFPGLTGPVTYTWSVTDVDDGETVASSSGTATTFTYTPAEAGHFEFTLAVSDSPFEATAQFIVVAAPPPVARTLPSAPTSSLSLTLVPSNGVVIGEEVTGTASVSNAPTGVTYSTFDWSISAPYKNGASNANTFSFSPDEAGSYTGDRSLPRGAMAACSRRA